MYDAAVQGVLGVGVGVGGEYHAGGAMRDNQIFSCLRRFKKHMKTNLKGQILSEFHNAILISRHFVHIDLNKFFLMSESV